MSSMSTTATREIQYRQAINEAIRQEMTRDETVIIMGEEIAGGVSTATAATLLNTLPVGFVTTTWYSPTDASFRSTKLRDAEVAPSIFSPSCIH